LKFFKENDKMPFILVAFGIILYLVLSNLQVVFSGISYVSSVAFPFILGSCVAFIINVPMSFFERKLFYKLKKGKRVLSLISIQIDHSRIGRYNI
jgi:predicted PurR-regulated permease PerM